MRVLPLLLLLVTISAYCVDTVPDWVLRGILRVETSSYYKNGSIVYVNKTRGFDGERGCFQMLESTFNEIRHPGERFKDLDDPVFAEYKAIMYLRLLYKRHKTWAAAVSRYNRRPTYLRDVRK